MPGQPHMQRIQLARVQGIRDWTHLDAQQWLFFIMIDGQLASDTEVFVWPEGVNTSVADLELRSFTDGAPVAGDSSETTTLPAGTQVCSYLVHADPIGAATVFASELDFGVVPLGFTLVTTDLEDTDEFALDGVDYQPEGLDPTDVVTVDGTVITIDLTSAADARDQIRIVIPC